MIFKVSFERCHGGGEFTAHLLGMLMTLPMNAQAAF